MNTNLSLESAAVLTGRPVPCNLDGAPPDTGQRIAEAHYHPGENPGGNGDSAFPGGGPHGVQARAPTGNV